MEEFTKTAYPCNEMVNASEGSLESENTDQQVSNNLTLLNSTIVAHSSERIALFKKYVFTQPPRFTSMTPLPDQFWAVSW